MKPCMYFIYLIPEIIAMCSFRLVLLYSKVGLSNPQPVKIN